MDQGLIAELRGLLQEVITPDLEALMVKLEAIQQQMMQSERKILKALACRGGGAPCGDGVVPFGAAS